MSYINVTNIQVQNNPAPFTSPLSFQITFECLKELPDELEWKIIYVGSSKDVNYDQILDSFTMGPLEYGAMQFDLESNAPDYNKIPQSEILGITAIILSVSYKDQEFFRVGYYVYNSYTDPELADNPPEQVLIDKVSRNILADKPRITRFDIKWGDEKEEEQVENTEIQVEEAQAEHEAQKKNLFLNEDDLSRSLASVTLGQNPFLADKENIEPQYHSLGAHNQSSAKFLDSTVENKEIGNRSNPFI